MRLIRIITGICVLFLIGCNKEPDGESGSDVGPTKSGQATKSDSTKRPTVAYVTNGIASFWVIAEKGAKDAGEKFNAEVRVIMPPKGAPDQKRMVEEVLAQTIDGVAISPCDPDNQGDLLEEIASKTKMITHDSDAPKSTRLCYVGMDNYRAGRMCGKLVKQAMPEGGEVMIFVGRLGQDNAEHRRQGVIDELLDRSEDPKRRDDPTKGALKGKKYTILDTRTDGFDVAKAKALAQDAIAKYPNLGCMVGLFAYNPPKIREAVKEAGKLGKIKIVAFDEDEECLDGIKDGTIYGTIVQNPYRYGYESVHILAELARGDESVLPKGKILDIPAREIKKHNVDEFRTELHKLMGKQG